MGNCTRHAKDARDDWGCQAGRSRYLFAMGYERRSNSRSGRVLQVSHLRVSDRIPESIDRLYAGINLLFSFVMRSLTLFLGIGGSVELRKSS